jgi:G3E family GTPase
MKINLLFGFLGSGKTTLAKHLLEQRGSTVKTAIIVNEFGEVGVDGDILRGQNIDVVELNSGCLCCTLRGSLMMALEELRDKSKVERVIVEATGISQPRELLDELVESSVKGLKIGPMVTVVDCAKFNKLQSMLGDFYLDQIEFADIVIANKVDLATTDQIESATRHIREINSNAKIFFAEQCRVPPEVLFGEAQSLIIQQLQEEMMLTLQVETSQAHGYPKGHDREGQNIGPHLSYHHGHEHQSPPSHLHVHEHEHEHEHEHTHDPHAKVPVQSFVVTVGRNGSKSSLEKFFQSLPDKVWRVKGFIDLQGEKFLIQFSLGQLEMTLATGDAVDTLVFIGQDMDRAQIEAQVVVATR